MGISDIATHLGVSRQRADQLSRQKFFPKAAGWLNRGKVWRTSDIERWARDRATPSENHRKCATHKAYRLTCAQYVALLQRSEEHCEICGAKPRVLHIDHDRYLGVIAGGASVRGLVCARCNAHLRRIDAGERPMDAEAINYYGLSGNWPACRFWGPPELRHAYERLGGRDKVSTDINEWWIWYDDLVRRQRP